ncbi:MAG: HlyD family type I secretion periplasmic adaptor subunit [Alphaproteobacteria bacterium]|uniref:HlyD family type I secretion periplasmic adaptor subunit n=1 Tax=Brevundimonas sp. TaxID=1871086 RepID=UPI00181D00FA|nr:HlyD family type I secretion periplasmic adaptor subunit [Brevundimonas sp.]MBU3970115.1 HlyD family type I secretion periplasmic adaptor subunit [Alphaproteobacteria bacterium]MBA3048699.1 HlyD family type I secretion periplasmic adaptor subunit [Brevundimonas sp.]MBU3975327.1 HlyD family type I secretion periplasmic adaptor subunit [Alphaproteobacteria bacterium]MBU4038828.1 HlyD family type I secretion periplasmic adaptor subunit [Alphaproteobacteria bacterium]MBU4135731.1 HlyD family ty
MTDTALPSGPPPPAAPPGELDNPRRELMIGGAIIVLFFVIFLGWAAVAPLDAGAYAQGQIAVSGNRQAVQHREGGVVSALLVAEGDTVRRGQVLLQLSSGELKATERGVASQVYALIAQRARLIAERDRLRAIPTPVEFANLPPEDAELARESLRIQQLQFGARRTGRSTETGVLGQRVAQLNEQIAGYEGQIAANIEQQRLIQEELAGMRSLAEKGYAPLTRVRALERTAAQLDGELGSLRAQIARSREAVGETRLQMSGVSTKMNEDVADQLRQIDVQLNELRPRMVELRAQIARNEVRAPASGEVVGLTIFTQGGVIQPGQTLMEIVPRDASQVIIAQIAPNDVDNLRVGLDTEVKFPGLRERNPPIIHGRVTRISADSFTVEETGASYFRAEIVVPASELAKMGRGAETLRPGAPVEVVVLLRKRTALTYLLEPLTNNLWRSGSGQ